MEKTFISGYYHQSGGKQIKNQEYLVKIPAKLFRDNDLFPEQMNLPTHHQ
jgi:hypothetical protein